MFETITLKISLWSNNERPDIEEVYTEYPHSIGYIIDDYLNHIAETNEFYDSAEYGPVTDEVEDSLAIYGFHEELISGIRHLIEVVK